MDAQEFNLLLKRISSGDDKAFELFYNTYKKTIKYIAYSVVSDWNYAEDIVTEVSIDIWNNSKKYINIKNPKGWLYKVVRNASCNFYRKYLEKHKKMLEFELVTKKSDIACLTVKDDYSNLYFLSDISNLNEIDREILIKKVILDYTHKEIAEELKIPIGTILWRYSNIMKNFKNDVKKKESNKISICSVLTLQEEINK